MKCIAGDKPREAPGGFPAWRGVVLAVLAAILLSACAQPSNPRPLPTQGISGGKPAWTGLGLTGSLILIVPGQNGLEVARLDLATGAMQVVFPAAPQAILSSALASPDGKQLLLVYAPPSNDPNQIVYTSLYLLPANGSGTPRPVLTAVSAQDAYFAPAWSNDGNSIYTSHFHSGGSNAQGSFSIDQVSLDGQVRPLIQDGEWPSISPDGKSLAYIATSQEGDNNLYQAGADGSDPHPALPKGAFLAVDAHFYAPDGESLVFSAVNPSPATSPSAWSFPFGVEVASAHNVPSDWYSLALGSGKISRLTNLNDTGMYASLSPDRKKVAFIAQSGIYTMNLDGSQLNQISELAATGTVDWVK